MKACIIKLHKEESFQFRVCIKILKNNKKILKKKGCGPKINNIKKTFILNESGVVTPGIRN